MKEAIESLREKGTHTHTHTHTSFTIVFKLVWRTQFSPLDLFEDKRSGY